MDRFMAPINDVCKLLIPNHFCEFPMSKVIAQVNLEFSDLQSVRSYSVQIYLHTDGMVRGGTMYQRVIGGASQAGVELKCSFNAFDAIQKLKMEGLVAKITHEANQIIEKKIKAGYRVIGGKVIDPVSIIKMLYNESRSKADGMANQQPNDTAQKDEGFIVEVVGMVEAVTKIAKVLSDFSYDVIGEMKIPSRISIKIGDNVKVKQSGSTWHLVA